MRKPPKRIRNSARRARCSVASFAVLAISAGVFAADKTEQTPWCRTYEHWVSRVGEPSARGGCPPEGACDIPSVRDAAAPMPGDLQKVIRVRFIIYRETDGTNPSASIAQVQTQAQILNTAFEPLGIHFIYTIDQVNDSQARHGSGFHSHAESPATQCNIHIIDQNFSQGTFPWDWVALTNSGGISMNDNHFSANHLVIIHEMGHTLGLWHTHHGVSEVPGCDGCHERADGVNGDTTGDYCSDTPATPANSGQCVDAPGNDNCIGVPWGDTLPENYMSYGSPNGISCWESFTPQQVARMHCWIESSLTGWIACSDTNDCNHNGNPDACDILESISTDNNSNGIPDECETIPGDLVAPFGTVNVADLFALLALWGNCGNPCPPSCPADLTGDCNVSVSDLFILVSNWG